MALPSDTRHNRHNFQQSRKENSMSCEPITLSNINLQGELDPSEGYFTAEMLRVSLGLSETQDIALGVRIAEIPAADFSSDPNNAVTWLWKPETVHLLMTSAASASVRSAIAAARSQIAA